MNVESAGASDFHHQLGKTIEGWSYIESALCSLFIKVTQMYPPMARSVFYSAAGFRARTKMLRVALESVNLTDEGMLDFWTSAIHKADKYSAFRNLVVHGDVVFVDFPESKHHKRHIILQGKQFWKADPDPKDVITYDQLMIADENIRRLGACMMFVLGRDAQKASTGLKECRDLITLLPNPPDSRQMDPIDLARFSSLTTVPFER